MGTASTKSGNRKNRQLQQNAAEVGAPPETQRPDGARGSGISERTWLIASIVILVLAAFLRFYDLDLVPLHHDEGVNGNFLVRLVRENFYQYDPANYHGPTLYYFAALFPKLLKIFVGKDARDRIGLTTEAIRFVTLLFGLATIWLVLTLRRNLGTLATLSAAALLAVSPGAVYLSRYFIHESLFVFFTLGLVVAGLKYYERANPVYLILAAMSAALLFATKETAIISVIVLLLAWAITRIYRALRRDSLEDVSSKRKKGREKARASDAGFIERVGGMPNLVTWIVAALFVFIALNILLYSSFFHNFPKGVWDALKTFEFWSKTGKSAHVHPFLTYVWWLQLQEFPLLILGAIGAMVTVMKPTRSFALFSALWAFGLTAAYSLIAYKTPWLALNFVIPLALSSGYAIQWIYGQLKRLEVVKAGRVAGLAIILVIAMGFGPGLVRAYTEDKVHWKTFIPGYQMFDLNFRNYDNDNTYYVYVYAHTRRDLLKMLSEIDRIAAKTQGGQTGITIVASEYWPMPWYLRNYTRVGYFGHMADSTEPIIIASQGQLAEVETKFGDRYQQVHSGLNLAGSYSLRPGVDLLLFTRRELVK